MTDRKAGAMVVSLDFELLWGVIDHHDIATYGGNIMGARLAVEKILELFKEYEIHATWAVVGFLLCKDREDLEGHIPPVLPQYHKAGHSTYSYIETIKKGEEAYYFAPDLVDRISGTRHQEIASHTFSHYYCLEPGQTSGQFEADMEMYKNVSSRLGNPVRSIVFPRNQLNLEYGGILEKHGIRNYRGNGSAWCYRESSQGGDSLIKRGLRLLDAYLNIFGHHCYPYPDVTEGRLCNVRSSRFFRPYSHRLARLEPMRIRRIKKQMLYAAKNSKVFHIWWHPHNFGIDTDANMGNLKEILSYHKELNKKYGFLSMSMGEVGSI